jgi:hypothetical protein
VPWLPNVCAYAPAMDAYFKELHELCLLWRRQR